MCMARVLCQQCSVQHVPSAPSCASILGDCTAHSYSWQRSRHGLQYVFPPHHICDMLTWTSRCSASSQRYCAFTRDTRDSERNCFGYSKRAPSCSSSSCYEHICRRCEVSHSRWTSLLAGQCHTGTRSAGSPSHTTRQGSRKTSAVSN
jgi:hypothetical protein